jgi:pimeloyl-ACP methyl ester carboxylesterase
MIEDIVGRYLRLDIDGVPQRIYYEEAGRGVPLLCLHTAGSDGRQYRGLLNDPEITSRFRCIVFDLPAHGKSSPAPGWWARDYQLTTASYVAAILAVSAALGLDRPVALGCSIGGRIVLDLAANHAEHFRAVIGLQSSGHVAPYYDTSWTHRPDVHGGEVCAAIVSGLMAPQSPEAERWETLWHYMQGGPGIFRGDLHFYKEEGDLRSVLHRIDTSICRVWLLTGDYDYSCTPEASRQTAAQIDGASFAVMNQLGHFPMSENYPAFRRYLLPVLAELLE